MAAHSMSCFLIANNFSVDIAKYGFFLSSEHVQIAQQKPTICLESLSSTSSSSSASKLSFSRLSSLGKATGLLWVDSGGGESARWLLDLLRLSISSGLRRGFFGFLGLTISFSLGDGITKCRKKSKVENRKFVLLMDLLARGQVPFSDSTRHFFWSTNRNYRTVLLLALREKYSSSTITLLSWNWNGSCLSARLFGG